MNSTKYTLSSCSCSEKLTSKVPFSTHCSMQLFSSSFLAVLPFQSNHLTEYYCGTFSSQVRFSTKLRISQISLHPVFTVQKDKELYSVKKYSLTAMESTVISKVNNLKKNKRHKNATVSAFLF